MKVAKYLMWVLWPSFIAAGMGVGIIFTLLDPAELVILGYPLQASRTAVYTLGFLILWLICTVASALSCFLQATSHVDEANRGKRPL